jgi:hypothetical protein
LTEATSSRPPPWLLEAAPIGAVALGVVAEKAFHQGVQKGLLFLFPIAVLVAAVARLARHARAPGLSWFSRALPVAIVSAAGLSAAFIYPPPEELWLGVLRTVGASFAIAALHHAGARRWPDAPWAGLSAILVALLVFRFFFERGEVQWNPRVNGRPASDALRFLLPVHFEGDRYTWSATGFLFLVLLQAFVSNKVALVLANVFLVLVTFATSWRAYRSAIFTLTTCLCMALGTQFYYAYAFSGCTIFLLLVAYAEVNLLALKLLLESRGDDRRLKALFLASLIACALCYDTWFDYASFLLLASAYLHVIARRRGIAEWSRVLRFTVGSTLGVACAYLAVRLRYVTEFTTKGHEHELIFGYSSPVLALEDLASNFVTYVYLAFSNYLPPWLVASSSLLREGDQGLIAAQNGYNPERAQLVVMHHHFLWHMNAGAVVALFLSGATRVLRRSLRGGAWRDVHLTVICLLIATGSTTHLLIKFRPFLSVPTLTYKGVLGILGVTILVGHALMTARERWSPRAWKAAVAVTWLVVVWSAFTRPAMFAALNARAGAAAPSPDPLEAFSSRRP